MPRAQLRYDEAEEIVLAFEMENKLEDPYNPLIVILRGVYGSGKSTFANELAFHARHYNYVAKICSEDDLLP